MTRLLMTMALVGAVLGLSACERETRKVREASHMNRPAMGGARNPDVFPGTAAKPPQPLQTSGHVSPYDENAFLVAQGQVLYLNMNCVGCHAMGGGGMGPALMDDEWIYGIDPMQIYITIVEGRPNGMPSYRGKLTEYQVWQLVAYVRAMSGQLRKDVSPSRTDHMSVTVPEIEKERENPTKQEPGAHQKEGER
jgi:cytochrome c oxidase cbb3-type subunit 3